MAKIDYINSGAMDEIIIAYYIHEPKSMKLIFAVLYVSRTMGLTRCCKTEGFLANVRYMSSSVRPSVYRLSVCLSVCLSSVTFVHPTRAIEIFRNVSMPFGTLAICDLSIKISQRSFQGNPTDGGWGRKVGLKQRGVAKYSDFGRFQGYISEAVQDRR